MGRVACFCECRSAFTWSHCCGLELPHVPLVLKEIPEEYFSRKAKLFLSHQSDNRYRALFLHRDVSQKHFLIRNCLGHLAEDQWGGWCPCCVRRNRAIWRGWLNVTVVIFSHHFLLILEIQVRSAGRSSETGLRSREHRPCAQTVL